MPRQYIVNVEKINELRRGDIIRNKATHASYVVTAAYGDYAIAVDSIHVSNPDEWVVIGIRD